jgi:hypothetical protein
MSTEIKHYDDTIKGELYLTQFYGGKKHGLSMQFTVVGLSTLAICQLNKSQVQDLVRTLQNWLGENELFRKEMDERVKGRRELEGLAILDAQDDAVFSDDY